MIGLLMRYTGLSELGAMIATGLAGALLAIALLFAVERHGEHAQKLQDDARADAARQAAMLRDVAAKQAEAAQQAADAANAAQLQTTLRNSYATVPDSAPAGVRLALNCARLRNTPAARDPEFSRLCGPPPRAKAAAKP